MVLVSTNRDQSRKFKKNVRNLLTSAPPTPSHADTCAAPVSVSQRFELPSPTRRRTAERETKKRNLLHTDTGKRNSMANYCAHQCNLRRAHRVNTFIERPDLNRLKRNLFFFSKATIIYPDLASLCFTDRKPNRL